MQDDALDYDPSDIEAERYTLASMMWSREAIAEAAELLEPRHFYRPAHQVLYRTMIVMMAADKRVDPVTLRAWLEADGDTKVLGGQGPVYLADLFGLPVNPMSVGHYARLVLAAALRRLGIAEARRIAQQLAIPSNDPEEVIARFDVGLESVRRIASSRDRDAMNFQAVTEHVRKERRTVVPGLLDEQDRMVVVAGEGRGKTTLAHQIGFCAAAGVHPFSWQTMIPPRRVLIADFENPALELGTRFSRLGEAARNYPGWDEQNIRFYLRMGGINLTRAADCFEFMDAIRRFEPHLVIAGPIYKMMTGLRPNEDGLRAHMAVAAFFDQVRERYGSAIWLESHAPLGPGGHEREMRPEGWNGWMKWPEFGVSLGKATKAQGGDNAVSVKRFRGDRIANRPWPSAMTRNQFFPTTGWPWQAVYDKGVLDTPLDLRGNGDDD